MFLLALFWFHWILEWINSTNSGLFREKHFISQDYLCSASPTLVLLGLVIKAPLPVLGWANCGPPLPEAGSLRVLRSLSAVPIGLCSSGLRLHMLFLGSVGATLSVWGSLPRVLPPPRGPHASFNPSTSVPPWLLLNLSVFLSAGWHSGKGDTD